jgi:hypothetical protein
MATTMEPSPAGGPPMMTSAAGLLALLEEEHEQLKEHALKTLIDVVDHHWAEVAGCISVCEALYEDEDFGPRKYAALLASKVRDFIASSVRAPLRPLCPDGSAYRRDTVCQLPHARLRSISRYGVRRAARTAA